METISQPIGGGSLLIAYRFNKKKRDTVLVVGNNAIAANRVYSALDADAEVILLSPGGRLFNDLQKRVDDNQIKVIEGEFKDEYLWNEGRRVSLVMVTTAMSTGQSSNDHTNMREGFINDGYEIAQCIAISCEKLGIPINVADRPEMCTFFMMTTHRNEDLQIGVCTNGQGCKLGSRIKRDIITNLSSCTGKAVRKISELRKRIRDKYFDDEQIRKRMIWLSNMSYYWSYEKLANLTDEEMIKLVEDFGNNFDERIESRKNEDFFAKKNGKRGRIFLVGSGPGDANLLTVAARAAIDKATLILADKLVPESIMSLIPAQTPVHIARKFPGNADKAQTELHELGLEALKASELDPSFSAALVVRLKQGDPYVFGRGGEEYEYFSKHGYEPIVIPGISSALAAPLLCNIPLTHRGIADRFLVQTATNRNGQFPELPLYIEKQTTVFLMGIHKLKELTEALIAHGWPLDVPAAVIERASLLDQRCVRSTLSCIANVMEILEQRPPGLLVIGRVVDLLKSRISGKEEEFSIDEGLLHQNDLLIKENGLGSILRNHSA